MVYFLIQAKFAGTVETFLENAAPELQTCVSVLHYEDIARLQFLEGTYVFTDLEQPRPELRTRVHDLYRTLRAERKVRILNNPLKFLQRTEFLKLLHARGINGFNVYRLGERMGRVSYPVFIRWADDHGGPRSPLLNTPGALFRHMAWMIVRGKMRKSLVVEYLDTSDSANMFRKYGAFRVGDRIVPRHLFHGLDWMVKVGTSQRSAEFLEEEMHYLRTNPHQDELMRIFQMAGIEYGRVDYTVHDGRLQIWEINTNPTIGCSDPASLRRPVHQHFLEEFRMALRELN